MNRTRRFPAALLAASLLAVLAGCGGSGTVHPAASRTTTHAGATRGLPVSQTLPGMPPVADPHNVYAADAPGNFMPAARTARTLVYVPNSESATVDEVDPHTYQIVRSFSVGALPQHIVPAYDGKTLYVTNDIGNSLTPIDPATGIPGTPIPVIDPYNMYFTPDGKHAVVMAERLLNVDFRDPHTFALQKVLKVPTCPGVNHADYTADGRYMFASCEFGSAMVVIDVGNETVLRTVRLPSGSSPQDVKLSPDGRVFYVADLYHGGVYVFSARSFYRLGFIPTGAGAHGLYPSRSARFLYVSNRGAGSVSLIRLATRKVVRTWEIPGGGSPDMGGVSASGKVLWLSGRYSSVVYAIDTHSGKLLARIPVGSGPHGLLFWPEPGRYSLGHTGIMR